MMHKTAEASILHGGVVSETMGVRDEAAQDASTRTALSSIDLLD